MTPFLLLFAATVLVLIFAPLWVSLLWLGALAGACILFEFYEIDIERE